MNFADILSIRYDENRWSLEGNSYEGITWNDEGTPKPSEQELIDIWDSQEFQAQRSERNVNVERRRAIVANWPVHAQFEALTEASMGRTEKLEELKNFIISVKEEFPKD